MGDVNPSGDFGRQKAYLVPNSAQVPGPQGQGGEHRVRAMFSFHHIMHEFDGNFCLGKDDLLCNG